MARLNGTWSEPRDSQAAPPASLSPAAAAIAAAARFPGQRAVLLAIAGVFEALAGPAAINRLRCDSDSMGGLDAELGLAAGGASLAYRVVCQLSDSWQRVETTEQEFHCEGVPNVAWQFEAEFEAPPRITLALSGINNRQAQAAAAVLDTCFAERSWPMTEEALGQELHRLASGGYDEYHEWSADYSLAERIDAFAALLEGWHDLNPDGRPRLIRYAGSLAEEDAPWPGRLAGILLSYRDIPDIAGFIEAQLASAPFTRDLLRSAQTSQHALPPAWVADIRHRLKHRGFNAPGMFTNDKRLFREIAGLLNAQPPGTGT